MQFTGKEWLALVKKSRSTIRWATQVIWLKLQTKNPYYGVDGIYNSLFTIV